MVKENLPRVPETFSHRGEKKVKLYGNFARLNGNANESKFCLQKTGIARRSPEKSRQPPKLGEKRFMKTYVLKTLFIVIAACGIMFVTSENADAQRRRGGLNRNQVDRIIRQVEQRTDAFVSIFNRSLDNSRLDGTRREDRLNERARDLESATDELRREFDRNDSLQENRNEVQKCLRIASGINNVIRRRNLGGATEQTWSQVRRELNALARVYNLQGLG
ncbi:MAG: hypothetical protein H7Z37_11180 [Pyrinomonadaceae bacterium]|nr:hypothetical protein [Pyrinomonadaceae bacterium]